MKNKKQNRTLKVWDNIKYSNILIIGITKTEERMGQKKYLKT